MCLRPLDFFRILIALVAWCALPGLSHAQANWPVDDPAGWLLAFVDVETTGLTPGYHEMIDIGIVMTDLDGAEIDEFFLRIQPDHPERTEDGARAVNAFDEDRWRELAAAKIPDAVREIRDFHERVAEGRAVLLVAFNSHFDAAFLDQLFRAGGSNWRDLYHYFVLDLPSMAWSLGNRGLTGQSLAEAFGVADEPHVAELHTGLTGARLNARIYRALIVAQK